MQKMHCIRFTCNTMCVERWCEPYYMVSMIDQEGRRGHPASQPASPSQQYHVTNGVASCCTTRDVMSWVLSQLNENDFTPKIITDPDPEEDIHPASQHHQVNNIMLQMGMSWAECCLCSLKMTIIQQCHNIIKDPKANIFSALHWLDW